MRQSDKEFGKKELLECELTEAALANIYGGTGGGSPAAPDTTGTGMPTGMGGFPSMPMGGIPGGSPSQAPTGASDPLGGLGLSSLMGLLGGL